MKRRQEGEQILAEAEEGGEEVECSAVLAATEEEVAVSEQREAELVETGWKEAGLAVAEGVVVAGAHQEVAGWGASSAVVAQRAAVTAMAACSR